MKKEQAAKLMKDFPEISEELKREARSLLKKFVIVGNNGEAFCTACESPVQVTDVPRHREETKCPDCNAPVECIRNYHNFHGRVVESESNICIFLPGPNDYLYVSCVKLRLFFNARELMPHISVQELQRYIFTPTAALRYGHNHYWQSDGNYFSKKYEEKWTLRAKFSEPVFESKSGYEIINVKCISETCMRHSVAELYSGNFIFNYLKFYLSHPGAERLIKCGLSEYVRNAVEETYCSDTIHWNETELHKMLGVSRDVLKAIREKSITLSSYNIISEHFPGIPLDKLIAYNNIVGYSYGSLERASRSVALRETEILKYLIRQNVKHIGDYGDYIRMCQELGYDLSDRNVVLPARLTDAHSRLVDIRQALEREEEEKRLRKSQTAFKKNYQKRIKLEFSNGNYLVRQPNSLIEIVEEGAKLSHCVGGYADRHANGELNIMFLRRKSEPDKPYYTVEVSTEGKIIQCRGYKNNWVERGGTPKPQEIIDFEEEYQKHLDAVFSRQKRRKTA